jgi:hypothetical protein
VAALGGLHRREFLHRKPGTLEHLPRLSRRALAVLDLGSRARHEGRHVMQEGGREQHIGIDMQMITLGKAHGEQVVPLRMLPAPGRMHELGMGEIVDLYLPGRIERNSPHGHGRRGGANRRPDPHRQQEQARRQRELHASRSIEQ